MNDKLEAAIAALDTLAKDLLFKARPSQTQIAHEVAFAAQQIREAATKKPAATN